MRQLKIKKLGTLALLTVLLIGVVFSGCTQKQSGGPSTPQAQPTKTQAKPTETPLHPTENLTQLLKKAEGLSYSFKLVELSELGEEIKSAEVWVSGENVRMEYLSGEPPYEFPGAVHIYTEQGEYYIYNPGNNKAANMSKLLKLALDQGFSVREFALDFGPKLLKDAKIVGKEKIDGKECLIVKKEGYTWWVWKEYGIPLKWVSENEVIKDGEVVERYTTTKEVRELKIEPVPQSMFELPPGVEIVETIYNPSENKAESENVQLTLTDFTELTDFAEDVTGKAFGRYIEAYHATNYTIGDKRYETILFKSDWDEVKSNDDALQLILRELEKRGIEAYVERAGRAEVVIPNVKIGEKSGTLYFAPLCEEGSNCGMEVDFEYELSS